MGGALLDRHRHIRCRAQALGAWFFLLIFFPFPGLGDLLASPLCGGGTEPCHLAAEAWALRTSTVLPVYLAIYRKVILKRRRACCSGLRDVQFLYFKVEVRAELRPLSGKQTGRPRA